MSENEMEAKDNLAGENSDEIAVIGMAGRFPGAINIDELWENLKNGIESISFLSDKELNQSDTDSQIRSNPGLVKSRGGVVDGKDFFDASFFSYNPVESVVMDPQIRIFHECVWEGLEHAGYNPESYNGLIGLYAGASGNPGWETLSTNSRQSGEIGYYGLISLNDKDFICTRIAYKLNLKGPALAVQTACSTSLVAIHTACQALFVAECDMALAGGVSITHHFDKGYIYQEGMILSPDAHCRAFDARAAGTIGGCGVGVVVLKLLELAIKDRDTIHAVIKGSAINNDGIRKSGYTAPSREGQTRAIRTALQLAEVESESITYVECHGTGTTLGDPIEIEALKQAFNTNKKGFCAIGSVKTNIGHLDAAAGVAGFIKTVLAIKHKLIPPGLHFENPNPKIDFKNSPFYVNYRLKEWKNHKFPLRAGISSFGIGGTNAHAILEEVPKSVIDHSSSVKHKSREHQLYVLSAKTKSALEKMTKNLEKHLKKNPGINLEDTAYTLQVGRQTFNHRKIMVGSTKHVEDIIGNLSSPESENVLTFSSAEEDAALIFMFSGQGSQYVNMGLNLYRTEPMFREEMDRCFHILKTLMGHDIKKILYPSPKMSTDAKDNQIDQTEIAQPVLFAFEFSLAKLLLKCGIEPDVMIGHSIGEYTAACLAGVFSLEDALKIVVQRGQLMQRMPSGAMLSVSLPEKTLTPLLKQSANELSLSLAAINSSSLCTVSGTHESIQAFAKQLKDKKYQFKTLHTSHAFHSSMMDPVLNEFAAGISQVKLTPPVKPYISNLTGQWIPGEQAVKPHYWSAHLRKTVRFAGGIKELLKTKNSVFVEIGPGNMLSTFVKKHSDKRPGHYVINLIPHPQVNIPDDRYFLESLGRLWLFGQKINWETFYSHEIRHRISLPTYPFEGKCFRLEEHTEGASRTTPGTTTIKKKSDIADWFYIPVWKQSFPAPKDPGATDKSCWIIFKNEIDLGPHLVKQLEAEGQDVIIVKAGPAFRKENERDFTINPGEKGDYERLFNQLRSMDRHPKEILHLWGVESSLSHCESIETGTTRFNESQDIGFYSLVYLAQALEKTNTGEHTRILVVSGNVQDVVGEEDLASEKSTVLGPVVTINQECTNIRCRHIDIRPSEYTPGNSARDKLVCQILSEARGDAVDLFVAYRNNQRWECTFEPIKLEKPGYESPVLRKNGVYFITGGLGFIGYLLARNLVRLLGAKLVLIGRSQLPPEDEWELWLTSHDQNDPISKKLKKLIELKEMGGEVLFFSVDAADRKQMERVVQISEEQLGPINGVIHSAGIVGQQTFHNLGQIEKTNCQLQFQPKIHGILTLENIFKDRDLDFCLVMSSLAALLGGRGLTAYSAANIFLDTFVKKQKYSSRFPWISINWDAWQPAQKKENQKHELFEAALSEYSLEAEQGINAFHRILQHGINSRVVVSTGELGDRIQRWARVKPFPSRSNRNDFLTTYVAPRNQVESIIADIFQEYLGIEQVGINDSFFDLGATSLDLIQINTKLNAALGKEIPLVNLLTYTTVSSFANHLFKEVLDNKSDFKGTGQVNLEQGMEKKAAVEKKTVVSEISIPQNDTVGGEVAIIGMAGKFPGAKNIIEFWENLKNGIDTISFFSDEELTGSGIEPQLIKNPDYIKAKGVIEDVEYFDASFFDYNPREAEMMDPQTRILHECTWKALEHAGYDPYSYQKPIGFYAGANPHHFWDIHFLSRQFEKPSEQLGAYLYSDKDYISTRISHKFNLKGPAFTMYTACSSSLVAVHLGCTSILRGECDMALAGGITVGLPQKNGYLCEEGLILSRDAHNRTFDTKASGSVFSDGAGVILLKKLSQALADGDTIHAVIKGSAINNDGNRKLAYTAPSVEGQEEVIHSALAAGSVEPESISYLEAHGTATPLGDLVEMEALNRVFGTVKKKQFCGIGSVKTNMGHLNTAAGITGLIKIVMALKHKLIPPSLHCDTPNPKIDFENSPFYLITRLKEWKNDKYPLRAGVSSFGIGGTNVHAILEESPRIAPSPGGREWKLLMLSAKTRSALEQVSKNVMKFLKENPSTNFRDTVYTLQVGRKHLRYRAMAVCSHVDHAVEVLSSMNSGRLVNHQAKDKKPAVIFMFPGQGSQYVNMGLELYQKEIVFQEEMDRCFGILKSLIEIDIKEILYPGEKQKGNIDIKQFIIAQPVIFTFEYALAKLLMSWGISPDAMIGYSFGEYAAACLSGVLSLEDALKLVVLRGRLIQQTPEGAMLSIPLTVEEVTPLLDNNEILSVAIDNGPSTIVAGPIEAVEAFEKQLKDKKLMSMRVDTSHALHSTMMESILTPFERGVQQLTLEKIQIPYISNVTGKWTSNEDVADPEYWVTHLKQTVRFADGIKELTKKTDALFIEVGPGRDLTVLVDRYLDKDLNQKALNLVRPPKKKISDICYLLKRLGWLWLYGATPNWQNFYQREKRRRISLPTYPFERMYFKQPELPRGGATYMGSLPWAPRENEIKDFKDWFYVPSWQRSRLGHLITEHHNVDPGYLFFTDKQGLGSRLVDHLIKKGQEVVIVNPGETFTRIDSHTYMIGIDSENDYKALFDELRTNSKIPGTIVHLWNITDDHHTGREVLHEASALERALNLGFHSPVFLAKALGNRQKNETFQIFVVSSNMQEVVGGDGLYPEKSVVMGPCKNISLEYPHIKCRSIDIDTGPGYYRKEDRNVQWEQITRQLLSEFAAQSEENIIAYRGNYRWIQVIDPYPLEEPKGIPPRLRENGIYLVTGGLGGVGLILAEYLAKAVQAKLVLIGRSEFPPRQQWEQHLENPDKENKEKGVRDKIRKLLEFENMGAEILVIQADVTDEKQVKAVFTRAEAQWGRINGVIHAAGLPDGTVIQLRNREESERVLAVKLQATLILDRIIKDKKPDFFILCSSMSSIITAVGQVAYCSANAFLDAYALQQSSKGEVFIVSINWDRWKQIGLAVITEKLYKNLTGEELKGGITPGEGIDVFRCILGEDIPQAIISILDIKTLVQQLNILAPGDATMIETIEKNIRDKTRYPRPEMETRYIPPGSETEQCLAEIWSFYLGFDKIGIKDDFFELGGDSLKAMTISSKINSVLDTEIPLTLFFSNPTIEETAKYIDTNKVGADLAGEIQPVETREYYILSPAQKRLYFLQQLDKEQIVYNENRVVFLKGCLDHQRLVDVFRQLISRHESYRTSIIQVNEEPFQRIHPASEVMFDIERLTLRENMAMLVEDEQVDWVTRNFVRPFDLSQAPLLRAAIVETGLNRYILLIDLHHIVHDRTSSRIFQEEISAIWAGIKLPSLKLQYKDYAEWKNSSRHQKKLEKQKTYWLDQFQDEVPVLNLPIDYPRPSIQVFPGHAYNFEINKTEAIAIDHLVSKEETTLFMLLFSVFHILLSILGGQEEIVIGTPVAARTHSDLESIMGMFVNTLALRNQCKPGQTFTDFIKNVKINTLNAFDNQDYPFEELVNEVLMERDVSRNPLFDVMFVLQNVELPQVELSPGLILNPYAFRNITSKFDITLEVVKEADKLILKYEYNTALFKIETIKRFTGYFKRIVSQVLQDPGRKISEIEVLSEKEKVRIMDDFNDNSANYPKEKTLQRLFREQAERTPDYIAVVGQGQIPGPGSKTSTTADSNILITYRVLDSVTGKLAGFLIEKGVQPDHIVGIVLERSVEMIIGVLGILKSGGAYLPIDPDYPEKRIKYTLRDSKVKLLLKKNRTVTDTIIQKGIYVVFIDDFIKEINPEPIPAHRHLECNPGSSLAYLLYTSGSTGEPKGVICAHSPLVNIIEWMNRICPMKKNDMVLLQNPFAFDQSIWGVFGWSFFGASTCLLDPGDEKEPQKIINTIIKHHVTMLHFVTSLLSLFLEYVEENSNALQLSCLKYIYCGGEVLSPELVEIFNKKLGGANQTKLYNMYGPTETHGVSCFDCRELKNAVSVPIGKPISNTKIYILGRGVKPLLMPVGIVGEIYIGGDCLGRGYLNNPHLTAEKFVFVYLSSAAVAPFLMYKTGDLARWLPDGNIDFLGRSDYQVKIRGFRIELAEIENRLLSYKTVKNAAVILKENAPNDKYLCAYIVPDKDFSVTQLRRFLSGSLPAYMVPSLLIEVDKIPLSPNGKINRRALPEPEINKDDKYLPPRDNIEEKLVEIWSEVLKINKEIPGIDSNFFELGGHSLKATVLVSKIHKAFNIKISLVEFFKTPFIRGLADFIKRTGKDRFTSVPMTEEKEYYPLSPSQKRVYISHQVNPESKSYNMTGIFSLEGKPDRQKLGEIFLALIKRHESLRTSFTMIAKNPVQIVHDDVEFELEYYDAGQGLRNEAENHEIRTTRLWQSNGNHLQGEKYIENTINYFIQPFDLSRAPLLGIALIKAEERKYILIIDMHHIVSDGISIDILVNDFLDLYKGRKLPRLGVQYKDFSRWQIRQLNQSELKKQGEYWLNRFKGEIPILKLPTDYPRPLQQSFEGDTISAEINEELTGKLKTVMAQHDVTFYMISLAIYTLLLSKYTGQDDIIVGTPAVGRRHSDLEKIVGLFINVLLMRNTIEEDKNFREFLEMVKENTLQAFDNQDYPFDHLVEQLEVKRDASRNPLYEVIFAQEFQEEQEFNIPGLDLKRFENTGAALKTDLRLGITERDSKISLSITYSTALFKKETIETILHHYREILEQVVSDQRIKLENINISHDYAALKANTAWNNELEFNF